MFVSVLGCTGGLTQDLRGATFPTARANNSLGSHFLAEAGARLKPRYLEGKQSSLFPRRNEIRRRFRRFRSEVGTLIALITGHSRCTALRSRGTGSFPNSLPSERESVLGKGPRNML
jgi:hypothetical protein